MKLVAEDDPAFLEAAAQLGQRALETNDTPEARANRAEHERVLAIRKRLRENVARDRPDLFADWLRRPTWTMRQACWLLMGLNPETAEIAPDWPQVEGEVQLQWLEPLMWSCVDNERLRAVNADEPLPARRFHVGPLLEAGKRFHEAPFAQTLLNRLEGRPTDDESRAVQLGLVVPLRDVPARAGATAPRDPIEETRRFMDCVEATMRGAGEPFDRSAMRLSYKRLFECFMRDSNHRFTIEQANWQKIVNGVGFKGGPGVQSSADREVEDRLFPPITNSTKP